MHYLNLPGEIRNEVYHALLHSSTTTTSDEQKPKQLNQPSNTNNANTNANSTNTNTTTLRLSAAGVLIPPTLAHTNALIRHELCSLLEHKTTTAPSVVLEAQATDFDLKPLHTFLMKHHSHSRQQTTTVKLTLHLTSPQTSKISSSSPDDNAKSAALRSFLQDSQSRGWSVGYRVKFDWTRFSIGDAAESARAFERAFISGGDGAGVGEAGSSGNAGEGLWRALKKAREAEVRRCLVERPARQRALMVEGRGRGMLE
jgi:hypothetical protein